MTSPLSSASTASKMAARRDPNLEPDDQWKETLKAQIQLNLASMVKDAETQYNDNLEKNPADIDRLKMEHAAAIDTIKQLATEEFKSQLERERSQRRWATGQELPPELAEDMKKEQQAIWDQIHSEKNSTTPTTDNALASSPSDLRYSSSVQSSVSPSVNVSPPPRLSKPTPRATLPEPRPPSQDDTDEESDAAQNRNARSRPIIPPAKPRDEDIAFGRQSWESNSVNLDRVPRPYSSSTTPPKPTAEVFWIPSASSEDIPASSRPQRRGSTASIRSTGSTSSRRPPIANAIPETTSVDDSDLAAKAEQERARIQDADQAWRKLDAAKDREQGLGRRRTLDGVRIPSTTFTPDPGTSPVVSNLSSSPSQSRRPPTPPLNTKPIYRKPSFAQDSPSHSLYRQPSFTQDAGPRSSRPNPSHLSLSRPPDMSFNGDSDSPYSQTPISATLALAQAQAAEGYPPYAMSPSYHRSPSPPHDPDFNMRTRSRNPSNEPRYTAPFSAGPLSSHNTPFLQGEQAYPSPPPSHRGTYSSSRSSTQQQPPYSASPYSSSQTSLAYPPSQIHTAYSARPSDDAESVHYSNGPPRSRSGMGNTHPDSHQQSNVRSSATSPDTWRSWSQQQQHPRDLRSPMSTNSLREQHRQQPTRDRYHSSPIYTDVLVDAPEGSGGDSDSSTDPESEESSPTFPPQSNFSSSTSHSTNSVRPMNMKHNSKPDIRRVSPDVESLEYFQMQAKERKMQREADAAKAKALQRLEMEKKTAEEEENKAREAAEEARRRKQEEEVTRKREEEEARAKQRELEAGLAREREIEAQRKREEDTRRKTEALRRKEEKKKEEERLKEDRRRRALAEEEAKLELAKEEARKEEARRERLRKEEDELRRREDEARKREDEIRRKEEELQRKLMEEKQREFERLEQEARRKEEEAQTRERLARLREEEARKKEAQIQEREKQLRVAEEELRRREKAAQEDARRRERAAQEEARRREEERAVQEAEELRVRQEQEKAAQEERLREERAAREERLRRDEAAAEEIMRQQKIAQEEQQRLESDIAWKQHEKRKAEEARAATRREEQAVIDRKKREDERKQIEADAKRSREQEKRQEEERKRLEMDKMAQQKEFQRREEEIRNRKRQDSAASWESWTIPTSGSTNWGTSQPSPNPPTSGTIPNGGTSTPQRSNTTSSSASAWSTKPPTGPTTTSTPGWSATPKSASASASATRTSSTSPSTPTPKTRTGSTGTSANPSFGAPLSEEQWHTRNEEQFRAQQERFQQEQERLERERMAKSGKVQGSKEEVIKTFEHHARLWEKLPEYTELRWDIFPWPMLNKPSSPEDITYNAIRTYVLSPHYPEKERPQKDRIKEHIRRWHPDRFETKLLTKVIDSDKERVREGAGSVVRSLNDLLTKSNTPSFFD